MVYVVFVGMDGVFFFWDEFEFEREIVVSGE